MHENPVDYDPADGPLGSWQETRRWQIRMHARLTAAQKLDAVEDLMSLTSNENVRRAIESRLAESEAELIPLPPSDR